MSRLTAPGQCAVDDLLEDGEEAAARMSERVERAGLNQRLDGPLVEDTRVDPLAEVVEVLERAFLPPLGLHEGDETLPDVAYGREPEHDRRLAVFGHGSEVGHRPG